MLKYVSIALGALLLFTACSKTRQPNIKAQPAKKQKIIIDSSEEESLNWQGYYFGILPCDECDGVKTWLKLDGTKKAPFYTLMENYEGENGKILTTKESAKWSKSDSIIYLKNRMVFVGENFITFIDNPSQMLKSEYTLEKLETFKSPNATLFVSPKSRQDGTIKGDKAWRFNGVENIKNGKEFLSTEGTYIINCKTKTYDLARVIYYKKSFAMGKVLNSITQNKENYLPIKSGTTLDGVFEKYCTNID